MTFTATEIIEQNEYAIYTVGPPATGDFTIENIEHWIDHSINYISNQVKRKFNKMTGTTGSKTIVLSDDLDAAFTPLMASVLRELKKSSLSSASSTSGSSGANSSVSFPSGFGMSQGSSVSSSISASSAINNPDNSMFRVMFEKAIANLIAVESHDWNRSII